MLSQQVKQVVAEDEELTKSNSDGVSRANRIRSSDSRDYDVNILPPPCATSHSILCTIPRVGQPQLSCKGDYRDEQSAWLWAAGLAPSCRLFKIRNAHGSRVIDDTSIDNDGQVLPRAKSECRVAR